MKKHLILLLILLSFKAGNLGAQEIEKMLFTAAKMESEVLDANGYWDPRSVAMVKATAYYYKVYKKIRSELKREKHDKYLLSRGLDRCAWFFFKTLNKKNSRRDIRLMLDKSISLNPKNHMAHYKLAMFYKNNSIGHYRLHLFTAYDLKKDFLEIYYELNSYYIGSRGEPQEKFFKLFRENIKSYHPELVFFDIGYMKGYRVIAYEVPDKSAKIGVKQIIIKRVKQYKKTDETRFVLKLYK